MAGTHGGPRRKAGRPTKAEVLARQALANDTRSPSEKLQAIDSEDAFRTLGDLISAQAEGAERLQLTIIKNQDRLLAALLDLACGCKMVRVTREGEEEVYTTPPDRQAIRWLMEMGHGRPTQRQQQQKDTTLTVVSKIPRPMQSVFDEEEDD